MCGVIFAENFNGEPVNAAVMDQFRAQRHRGTEGFGAFDRLNQRLVRATKERKMLGWLKNHPQSSILFHHRMPTSTANRKGACHPFSTRRQFDTNYVLVHNGHIYNSRTLKGKHEAKGIQYTSWQEQEGKFNDSESLLWDVALHLEGQQDKLEAYGNIAFICLAIPNDRRKATKLYFARNSNPLKLQLTDDSIRLSSEGEGVEIERDTLYCYNYKSHALTTTALEVPSTSPFPNRTPGSYTGFTPDYSTAYAGGAWSDDEEYDEQYRLGYKRDRSRWLDTSEDDDTYGSYPTAYTRRAASGELSPLYVLPDDEDYSYGAIFPEIKQEVVISNADGSQLNVKQTILDRMDTYLETVDGRFNDADALIAYDLHTLRRQLIADELQGFVQDDDLALEIDLLQLSREALAGDPAWKNSQSQDMSYAII